MGLLTLAARWLALLATLLIVAAVAACGSEEPGAVATAATTVAAQPTATVPGSGSAAVDAANAFLESLTPEQRGESMYSFDDSERSEWSNLPAGFPRFVGRNGVRIGDLDPAQIEAMLVFLASALGDRGYETTLGVLGADAFLSKSNGRFGDYNYWLAFFGETLRCQYMGMAVRGPSPCYKRYGSRRTQLFVTHLSRC